MRLKPLGISEHNTVRWATGINTTFIIRETPARRKGLIVSYDHGRSGRENRVALMQLGQPGK